MDEADREDRPGDSREAGSDVDSSDGGPGNAGSSGDGGTDRASADAGKTTDSASVVPDAGAADETGVARSTGDGWGPVDPEAPRTIRWRRDASTSAAVRVLWSLGVGTFFAMVVIIVTWRLYGLTGQAGGQSVVVAAFAALVATALVVAVDPSAHRRLGRLAEVLSLAAPSPRSLARAVDAVRGTLVMGVVIGSLMGLGRLASQTDVLGDVGAGPFTGLAAGTLPLALVALVAASYGSSAGALDPDEGVLYVADADHAVDLSVIVDVSVRRVGGVAVVTLTYATPDNRYVPGPRRLVVPPNVADGISDAVDAAP